jgi:hypothetical protein
LPLALVLLFAALILPSAAGFFFFAVLKVILLFWLVVFVAGVLAAGRFRRHVRRHWQSGDDRWYHDHWHRQ